jgi:hypothetical protein
MNIKFRVLSSNKTIEHTSQMLSKEQNVQKCDAIGLIVVIQTGS